MSLPGGQWMGGGWVYEQLLNNQTISASAIRPEQCSPAGVITKKGAHFHGGICRPGGRQSGFSGQAGGRGLRRLVEQLDNRSLDITGKAINLALQRDLRIVRQICEHIFARHDRDGTARGFHGADVAMPVAFAPGPVQTSATSRCQILPVDA